MKKSKKKALVAGLSVTAALAIFLTAGHFTGKAIVDNYNKKVSAEPDSKNEQVLDDIEGNIGGGATENSGNSNNQSTPTKPNNQNNNQTNGNNKGEQNQNGNSSGKEQNTTPAEPEQPIEPEQPSEQEQQPTEPTLTAEDEYATVIDTLKQVREAAESLTFNVKEAVKTINEQKSQIEALKAKYPDAAELDAQANIYVETLEKVVYSSAIEQGLNLATSSDYYQIDATQFGGDAGVGKLYVSNATNLYAVETPSYLSYVDNSCFYNYDLLSGRSSTQDLARAGMSQVDFVKNVLTTGSEQLINDESTTISYTETDSKDSAYTIVIENDEENQHLNYVFAEGGELKTFEGSEVKGEIQLKYDFSKIDEKTFTKNYDAIVAKIDELNNALNI